jgi:hypothetical protein
VQGSTGNVFDALHELNQIIFAPRQDRCEADAAIAHDDGRDSVPGAWCYLFVPTDLAVEVRVDVDEPGSYQVALGIDFAFPLCLHRPDCSNETALDGDVAIELRGAGTVNDASISNDKVGHSLHPDVR